MIIANVADCKMGKIYIATRPIRIVGEFSRWRQQSYTENCQLKSKVSPFRRLQITRVIPPFGAKIRMSAKVCWEGKWT